MVDQGVFKLGPKFEFETRVFLKYAAEGWHFLGIKSSETLKNMSFGPPQADIFRVWIIIIWNKWRVLNLNITDPAAIPDPMNVDAGNAV